MLAATREARRAARQDLIEITRLLIANPVFSLPMGFLAVELLQRFPEKRPLFSGTVGNVVETAMVTPAFMGALASATNTLGPLITSILTKGVIK